MQLFQRNKLEYDMASEALTSARMHIMELPNDLWLEIMSYLSYLDLQQLRLVNWRCRDLVNRRCFVKKSITVITKDNLKEIKSHVQRGISYLNFEQIELRSLTQSRELQHFLRMIGPKVRQIEVRHSPVFRNMDGNLPNLRVLKIASTSILDGVNMSVDGINLKQFHHLEGFECDGVSLDASLKFLMLMQLRHVENKVRLRKFQFEYRRNNEHALLEVLYDHAPTLECVDIFFSCSPGIQTDPWCMAFERMRKLRTLKLSGNCHLVMLDDILESVPDTAKVEQLDLTGMLSLSNEMVWRISQKWPKTLRYLDVMFCVQLDTRCVHALRDLKSLRTLTMAYCRGITGIGLVEGLTSEINYQLQELNLEDVCFIDESALCTMLERLPNLRRLSLDNSRQGMTDQVLATIFKCQIYLRVLHLDYCVKLTDSGFMGFGEQPYTIQRLRGLREISVRGCRNLTDRTLRRLNLPELLSVAVDYCNRMETGGIATLCLNNPSLEALSIASCTLMEDEAVRVAVVNLKRLRTLNFSNCSMMTIQSFKYVAKYGRSLRNLIACGIDNVDPDAARRILSRRLPFLKEVLL